MLVVYNAEGVPDIYQHPFEDREKALAVRDYVRHTGSQAGVLQVAVEGNILKGASNPVKLGTQWVDR